MPTQEDIVIVKYVADVTALKTALDSSNKKLGEQGAIVDQNGKKITALSNNFNKSGQVIGESMIKGSNGMKALTAQVDKAEQEIIALGKATSDVGAKTETLRQQYKKAMIDVQNGVAGAAEKAGKLKDQMDDAAESVRNLASGSKMEQFGNTLGSVSGKLASLDFEGAAEQAKLLGDITAKMSFKEIAGQAKNLGSTLLNTFTSMINPATLAIGALAGIGYAIYSIITAEDAEVKQLKKVIAAENERFKISMAGYDNEIALAEALGKSTALLQRQKIEGTIKNTKLNLELSTKVYALERDLAIRTLAFIHGREKAEQMVRDKEQAGENEKYTKKLDLELALKKAETDLQVDKINTTKGFANIAIAGVQTEVKKIEAVRHEAAKKEIKIKREEFDQFEIIEKKKVGVIEASVETEKTLKFENFEDNLKKLEDSTEFEKANYDNRLALLKDFLENGKITQEQYDIEANEIKEQQFQEDVERLQKKFEAAEFFVNQLDSLNSSISQIQKNRLKEGETLSKSQQQAQFNREKAFNIAQAGINGAQAVLKAYAMFGPPPSPLGIAAAVFAGIATAAQIGAISSKQFVPLAEGTPLVSGGITGKDSVPAMLMPSERVVPVADNMKHWDDLEAIRKGNYESHIRMKYIVPALRDLQSTARSSESESLAGNIANGLMMNGTWKGQNIVKALSQLDDSQRDNTKFIVKALKSNQSNKRRVS